MQARLQASERQVHFLAPMMNGNMFKRRNMKGNQEVIAKRVANLEERADSSDEKYVDSDSESPRRNICPSNFIALLELRI